jgi:hypothetical protein
MTAPHSRASPKSRTVAILLMPESLESVSIDEAAGDLAEDLRKLFELFAKEHVAKGSAWRTEAEISRDLLILAERRGVILEPIIRQNLKLEAERLK